MVGIILPHECRADFPLVRKSFRNISKHEAELSVFERLTEYTGEIKLDSCQFRAFDRFASSPNDTTFSTDEIDERMRSLLLDGISPRSMEYFQMLGLAISGFISENYKFAFLESFMLLEVVIADFLREKKISAGVSKSRLK